MQLYGLDGKVVASFEKELSGNHVMMHLDKSISTGIYLLKLSSGGNTYTTRMVVKGN
jgi:hypothetical protein